jgi:hypothetical protein
MTLRVVKVDVARDHRADEETGVSVPAAVAPGREHEVLDIEIRRSLRLQLQLPLFVAGIRITADLNLLTDVLHGGPHRQDLIQEEPKRWGRQGPGHQTEQD